MKTYEKPRVLLNEEMAEGVYAASGVEEIGQRPVCDSIYMNGVWQPGKYNSSSYKECYGCNGCPAETENGCGLDSHYADSDYAASYDVDKGKRKPSWEKEGHRPDEEVKW